jgi:uncharacterized membrane protein
MAQLVVLGVDNRDDAERLLIWPATWPSRSCSSSRTPPTHTATTRARSASTRPSTLWGTLIGLIFLMPVGRPGHRAASGAIGGKLADVGINDDTIKQIASQLKQGRAAVFLLARSATVDRVIEAVKPFNPTVIQPNLTKEREEELVRALQS